MDALGVPLGNPAKETLPLNVSLRRRFHFIPEVGTERPGHRGRGNSNAVVPVGSASAIRPGVFGLGARGMASERSAVSAQCYTYVVPWYTVDSGATQCPMLHIKTRVWA